ncbi:TonB-dependent receptor [Opitutaceae bacterium]
MGFFTHPFSAIKWALCTGTLLGTAFATAATAAQVAEVGSSSAAAAPSVNLTPVVVTGSRLPPDVGAHEWGTRVLSVEDVDAQATWVDRLKALPQMGGGVLSAGRFGSLAAGTAAVALRGLPADSTLVLIEGRRVPVYPFAEGGASAFVDLHGLPSGAVRAIEVLPTHAAAIYGSDAVAGVVNVRWDASFSGEQMDARYANTTDTDTADARASIVVGRQTSRTGFVVAFDFQEQAALYQRDRAFSASDDKRPLGGSDFRSSVANPGTVNHPVSNQRLLIPATSNGTVTVADLSPGTARFDRGPYQVLLPEAERSGLMVLGRVSLHERWDAFVESYARRTDTRFELSPAPIQGDEQGIKVPAQNPFNPFGADAFFRYRMSEAGARTQEIRTDSARIVAGVRGALGDRWYGETAFVAHAVSTLQQEANNLYRPAVIGALAQTDPSRALNVFGAGDMINSPAVIDDLTITLDRRGHSRLRGVDAHAFGPIGSWQSGDVLLALGAEYRWEDLADRPDPRAEQGNVIDFKSTSSRGDRETGSAFVEVRLPLAHRWEGQVALRADHTDDYGDSAVPFASLRWVPHETLAVRAAYGQSFRAPSLAQLYSAETRQTRDLRDTRRFALTGAADDRLSALLVRSGGTANLAPEESDHANIGFVWTAVKPSGLRLAVDAYRIDRSAGITEIDPQYLLDNEALFPGLVQRIEPSADEHAHGIPGRVTIVNSTYQNLARTVIEGTDAELSYERTIADVRFVVRAEGAWTTRYEEISHPGQPVQDLNGTYARPEWRGQLAAQAQWRQWTVGADLDYIAGFTDTTRVREVASDRVFGAFAAYQWRNPAVSLHFAAQNLSVRPPPFADNVQGYVSSLSDPRGRVLSASIRMKW